MNLIALSRDVSMRQPLRSLAYRADIDGLRALAIASVVLYHIGVPGFGGGFVGVDVFFVISGYLMSSLISDEIAEARFGLLRFYERRIRRIFPALFAMLFASCVAAWFLLMPVEFEYFARSLKAAALFSSNIQFERETGYFDIGTHLKPLLHTWSLSIEEQFYILFPLLLLTVARFGQQHKVSVLAGLSIASFAASTWMVYQDPRAAFYLLQFRAWELLLGALIAEAGAPVGVVSRKRQWFAALGIAMIALSVFAYTDKLPFPGCLALLPCGGAVLVLYARTEGGLVGKLMGSRPLVFLGSISYSLYLWHWPFIVFINQIIGRNLLQFEKALIVVGSLVTATLSWKFIEGPFRGRQSPVSRKMLFFAAGMLTVLVVIFGGVVLTRHGLPGRLPTDAQKIYSATYDVSRFSLPPCLIDTDAPGPSLEQIRNGKLCTLGAGSSTPSFLVWGDSHAAAMTPAIDRAATNADANGLLAAHSSCPPLPGVELSRSGDTKLCGDFNRAVLDFVSSRRIPLVFLIAYWPKYVHNAELPNEGVFFDPTVPPPVENYSDTVANNLDSLMHDLKKQGTKVVLVMDVPEMGYHMPEALAKAMMSDKSTDLAPPWNYVLKRQALSRAVLSKAAARYGAEIIDPLPSFCEGGHCVSLRDGMPLYKDSDHITATTSIGLSGLFDPIFKVINNK